MSGDRSRFELQPTLEGTLVRLRPLHPDDFDALYGVAKDPSIWEQHPARDRSHWGGIYNAEMKRLMLGHAFRFVDRVIFLVGPHNIRSQRAVEKIGGVHVGTRTDASGRTSFVYQITAAAFARAETRSL